MLVVLYALLCLSSDVSPNELQKTRSLPQNVMIEPHRTLHASFRKVNFHNVRSHSHTNRREYQQKPSHRDVASDFGVARNVRTIWIGKADQQVNVVALHQRFEEIRELLENFRGHAVTDDIDGNVINEIYWMTKKIKLKAELKTIPHSTLTLIVNATMTMILDDRHQPKQRVIGQQYSAQVERRK